MDAVISMTIQQSFIQTV